MSINIDDHLRRLLEADPESAEVVNIRIARNLHADVRLLPHPWGNTVAQTPDVWGFDDLQLDLDLVRNTVFASVWTSEHQYRLYADVGIPVASSNTRGFGWIPLPDWETQLLGWPEDVVVAVGAQLKKNPPIDW